MSVLLVYQLMNKKAPSSKGQKSAYRQRSSEGEAEEGPEEGKHGVQYIAGNRGAGCGWKEKGVCYGKGKTDIKNVCGGEGGWKWKSLSGCLNFTSGLWAITDLHTVPG